MLLTLTTTHRPATDLGFLLHKHPERAQSFTVAAGTAHVFYPVATPDECTAALLVDIDPIELVRGRHDSAFTLGQYVNDRPYAAGSMLAVALGSVFRTAMNGIAGSYQDLADQAIPLHVHVPALPARGGADLVTRLFEPLGWDVGATSLPMDPAFPEWGQSPYVDLRLTGTLRLGEALRHLYVLLPVLDNAKHYWVTEEEVTKLLRAGEGWLAEHPEREFISRRYLAHRKAYVRFALSPAGRGGRDRRGGPGQRAGRAGRGRGAGPARAACRAAPGKCDRRPEVGRCPPDPRSGLRRWRVAA
ncbi:3' terminal RNA ribose 2'-O-methyltransferase Hen1 [Actinocrispum wychmicini]|uniref:3' terminal RNA ribose 2'-O-methyltransferase Hen1 n=1 Tax=Actinocrispum wychmicini TaxID=1213861 RepID=A0A4R2JMZ3_9PSEU|nr:3' terminal RNA ribose 2'-O-methyltransferase Hen1 [Actinocrispum wychmicini]